MEKESFLDEICFQRFLQKGPKMVILQLLAYFQGSKVPKFATARARVNTEYQVLFRKVL